MFTQCFSWLGIEPVPFLPTYYIKEYYLMVVLLLNSNQGHFKIRATIYNNAIQYFCVYLPIRNY